MFVSTRARRSILAFGDHLLTCRELVICVFLCGFAVMPSQGGEISLQQKKFQNGSKQDSWCTRDLVQ